MGIFWGFSANFRAAAKIGALTCSLVAFATVNAGAAPTSPPRTKPLDEQALSHAIEAGLPRVEEFEFIRANAAKLGVRVWLFGGTAASLAHYVKSDLERQAGDSRFQIDRFGYHYYDIYRSTQDLDIVIDGTPEQAAALRKALIDEYPYAQGGKSDWEIRLLRQDYDPSGSTDPASPSRKEALLGSASFQGQHTDSNSTGMIEVTAPPKGEPRIRDVRDFKSRQPAFLTDLLEGKLTYYYSPETHPNTARYRLGLNPPIFSAIRALTKAGQSGARLSEHDLANLRKVVSEFDPKRDLANSGALNWMNRNVSKLYQHSIDLEHTRALLEQTGMRAALSQVGDPKAEGSVAWWVNKAPLRSYKLGETFADGQSPAERDLGAGKRGSPDHAKSYGKSAEELGFKVVAHETNSFLAYESITRSPLGVPNVFTSRTDVKGENAFFGQGLYTLPGKIGGRGTGITIRFQIDPRARAGIDFTLHGPEAAPMLLFHNRNALTIIHESIQLDLVSYYRLLASPESRNELGWTEKLRTKLRSQWKRITPHEMNEIREIVRESISGNKGLHARELNPTALVKWLTEPSVPVSEKQAALHEALEKAPALMQSLSWAINDRAPELASARTLITDYLLSPGRPPLAEHAELLLHFGGTDPRVTRAFAQEELTFHQKTPERWHRQQGSWKALEQLIDLDDRHPGLDVSPMTESQYLSALLRQFSRSGDQYQRNRVFRLFERRWGKGTPPATVPESDFLQIYRAIQNFSELERIVSLHEKLFGFTPALRVGLLLTVNEDRSYSGKFENLREAIAFAMEKIRAHPKLPPLTPAERKMLYDRFTSPSYRTSTGLPEIAELLSESGRMPPETRAFALAEIRNGYDPHRSTRLFTALEPLREEELPDLLRKLRGGYSNWLPEAMRLLGNLPKPAPKAALDALTELVIKGLPNEIAQASATLAKLQPDDEVGQLLLDRLKVHEGKSDRYGAEDQKLEAQILDSFVEHVTASPEMIRALESRWAQKDNRGTTYSLMRRIRGNDRETTRLMGEILLRKDDAYARESDWSRFESVGTAAIRDLSERQISDRAVLAHLREVAFQERRYDSSAFATLALARNGELTSAEAHEHLLKMMKGSGYRTTYIATAYAILSIPGASPDAEKRALESLRHDIRHSKDDGPIAARQVRKLFANGYFQGREAELHKFKEWSVRAENPEARQIIVAIYNQASQTQCMGEALRQIASTAK